MNLRGALALAVLFACPIVPARSQAAATDTAPAEKPALTVCMQANDPPLSLRGRGSPSGFDVALSRIIAQRLDRDLRVQWFVSRDDPDASLSKDANALLSYGRCQLVAEYPLVAATLERPYSPSAKLPPFDGATPDDRRRWVKINELAATRPYRLNVLTVVLAARDAGRKVRKLADLDGLKIGVQIATLPDAIAMRYEGGRLTEHVEHLPDARDLFEKLQSGSLDAAFVDLRAFDAWRIQHGSSGLAASGYMHSVGFNMGFVGLASDIELVKAADAALADLQAHDALAPLAASEGLTLVPPRTPAVLPDVSPSALDGD